MNLFLLLLLFVQDQPTKIVCTTSEQFGCDVYAMKSEFIIYNDYVVVRKVIKQTSYLDTLWRQKPSKYLYLERASGETILFKYDYTYVYMLGVGYNLRFKIFQTYHG